MRRYCRATEQEDPVFVLEICCFHQDSNGVAILAHATYLSGGRTGIPPMMLHCTVLYRTTDLLTTTDISFRFRVRWTLKNHLVNSRHEIITCTESCLYRALKQTKHKLLNPMNACQTKQQGPCQSLSNDGQQVPLLRHIGCTHSCGKNQTKSHYSWILSHEEVMTLRVAKSIGLLSVYGSLSGQVFFP